MPAPLRLDLGAGGHVIPGFTPLDGGKGDTIFPLPYPDGSVDEIRASHVLEHFPHGETDAVLGDWVRALKPGGRLRLAVPDFRKIAEEYLKGDSPWPIQGYVMGGQTDGRDFHKTIFDRDGLCEALTDLGMAIGPDWESEVADCARLPVSLNISATKPVARALQRPAGPVQAVMSVPRLGFMDNFFCALDAFPRLGITLRKFQGAFWNQCLSQGLEFALADGAEWVLTVDYDTVFRRAEVEALLDLAARHPEVDAIAALQVGRTNGHLLATALGADGTPATQLPAAADLVPARTAHFGLTMIRASAIAALPKPWLHGSPAPDGGWGDGRTDADIAFWLAWERAGRTLRLAPKVVVGHAEMMILWPGPQGRTIHQHSSDFWKAGKPAGVFA